MEFGILLLLTFLLSSLAFPSEGHHPFLGGKGDYEVIRPVRLHILHKTNTQSVWPDVVGYRLTMAGRHMELHLERNQGLFAPDYSETHYTKNGSRVTSSPGDLDLCCYSGTAGGGNETSASISICHGLRGYIKTAAEIYLIEPLSDSDTGDHALFKYEHLVTEPRVCGVHNHTLESAIPFIRTRGSSGASALSTSLQEKYIELYLVVDHREYRKMNSDLAEVRRRIFDIVIFVNMVYKPLHTHIILVGVEVWTDQDKIQLSTSAGETLDSFTKWRNDVLMNARTHDNAQLITAMDFEGGTVGLAYVGTICQPQSTGLVQDSRPYAISTGVTLAHEMGHNLGMSHDTEDCTCPEDTCIMSAVLSYNPPRFFSSCSQKRYELFQESWNLSCILNKPVAVVQVCGNGLLEVGEECDCSTEEECTDPCCNAATCRLVEGVQCVSGDCCENCKIAAATRECRPRRDDCDLPEFCTGRDASCPEDVFAANGLPCGDGQGYCYDGRCPMRSQQCIRMWGETAKVAADSCYELNTHGIFSGFGWRVGPDGYFKCNESDMLCGKLFCANGSDTPSYGQPMQVGQCKATFYGDPSQDRGQVEVGSKCGEGQVCWSNQCVDLEVAYMNTHCSENCPGHAVCNHKSECQCEPGWLPPTCSSQDAQMGAQDQSQGSISLIVIVIVAGGSLMILLVLGGVALVLIRRRNRLDANSICSSRKGQNYPTASLHSLQICTISHNGMQDPCPPLV
nr:zinc metalloproteinase-disintegrin-like atrolysin-A isoform X1 [Paramormyrops kingsleyae]